MQSKKYISLRNNTQLSKIKIPSFQRVKNVPFVLMSSKFMLRYRFARKNVIADTI